MQHVDFFDHSFRIYLRIVQDDDNVEVHFYDIDVAFIKDLNDF